MGKGSYDDFSANTPERIGPIQDKLPVLHLIFIWLMRDFSWELPERI
jgi:hypothetical protein